MEEAKNTFLVPTTVTKELAELANQATQNVAEDDILVNVAPISKLYIEFKGGRTLEDGTETKKDKLFLSGQESSVKNEDEVYGILIWQRSVYVKREDKITARDQNRSPLTLCFSENQTNGWFGKTCPNPFGDRKKVKTCKDCRATIMLGFLLTDENGVPKEDCAGNKVLFAAICDGMKFMPALKYIQTIKKKFIAATRRELPQVDDNKLGFIAKYSLITKISVGKADSQAYGTFSVFEFDEHKWTALQKDEEDKLIINPEGLKIVFTELNAAALAYGDLFDKRYTLTDSTEYLKFVAANDRMDLAIRELLTEKELKEYEAVSIIDITPEDENLVDLSEDQEQNIADTEANLSGLDDI